MNKSKIKRPKFVYLSQFLSTQSRLQSFLRISIKMDFYLVWTFFSPIGVQQQVYFASIIQKFSFWN